VTGSRTATPATRTPRRSTEDDGCAVSPASSPTAVWLLAPLALLLFRRRM